MAFILYILVGFFSGVLGGMGMGGGTILIPALTILLGVPQHSAQATNVIAFLPMAAIALPAHKKNGLLRTESAGYLIIPAVISTVIAGLIMAALPSDFLRKLFGIFLIALAVKEILSLLDNVQKKRSQTKS